jgi:hypothetical protein
MNHDPKSLNELIKASKYCGNCGAKFDEVKRGKFCFIHAEHLFCIECLSCLYTGRNLRKPSKMCLIFFFLLIILFYFSVVLYFFWKLIN